MDTTISLANGNMTIDKPYGQIGFLYIHFPKNPSEDGGRILFNREEDKLNLHFNQTAFAIVGDESYEDKRTYIGIRDKICEALGGIDKTDDRA